MPKTANTELYQLIASLKIVDETTLKDLQDLAIASNLFLPDLLVEKDLVETTALGKILADFYDLPFVDLTQNTILKNVLSLIPKKVAQSQQSIVFKQDESGIHLATSMPKNKQLAELLAKKTGLTIKTYYATDKDIQLTLSQYDTDIKASFQEMMTAYLKEVSENSAAEPPIIELVDSILNHAYDNRASDIHIEPNDQVAFVRFRIDGMLQDVLTLPMDIYTQVNTRLKVTAHLRTDEQQSAQDGKLSLKMDQEDLDVRISFVPVNGGENIVMRLLSESSRQFSLLSLGFSDSDMALVKTAYEKPHGMILITGPTGSGKTTTMYAILKLLNKTSVNIMTIEDPVEYDIERVQQIQVNPATNLTFALGLRSIVRQDPDIILVGEIRDEETASISINAAMTGHLLLSTLHTNDATTALPRLIDMGIEPYLITSTVNVIVAQRLVRKICQVCRVSKQASETDLIFLKNHTSKKLKTSKLYTGKGCSVCHQTGYNGRVAIFEVLVLNDELRAAIVAKKDAGVIHDLAVKNGMSTMLEDGLNKIEQGLTTIEEVLRVTKD